MKKFVLIFTLLGIVNFYGSSSPNGDYICSVRVRTSSGDVYTATATSDVSYKDACEKAYAQAMQNNK